MTVLDFVLSADAVSRIRDILICLSRFNETVEIEATAEQLTLSALNSSRTSFAAFRLDRNTFFQAYTFSSAASGRFSGQVFNKAFFSIFKTRASDARDQDTSIERCEISIHEDPDVTECRLAAKLTCMHGVKKTFKLTYEPTQTMYPSFNSQASQNTWSINAYSLRALSEHFGPRTEHVDFFHDAGRLLMTGYTEKIARGSEILKQALQTTITVDGQDFEKFNVEEHLHVGISVKDFKAVILHAASVQATITAMYSQPKKPLQLAYSNGGMQCTFTLVTMTEYLGSSIKVAQPAHNKSMPPPVTRDAPSQPGAQNLQMAAADDMPAPPLPASRSFSREIGSYTVGRPSPPPPQASINQESLFLADDDDEDDRRWGPEYHAEDTDAVRWDSGGHLPTRTSFSGRATSRTSMVSENPIAAEDEVPPTQRMSQIRGLFDD